MSGFTSQHLEKRLADLNSSAQAIQTFSLWIIHHRKHHKVIVQTWFKELKKASQSRKLTFMYLANDVIQNSRKKGPEFTKEFASALKPAFLNVAREADDKTWKGLDRILTVWAERNIYDQNQINEYRKIIGSRKDSKNGSDNSKENTEKPSNTSENKVEKSPSHETKRQKTSHKSSIQKTNLNTMPKSNVRKQTEKYTITGESFGRNHSNDSEKIVDAEVLIRTLQNLENSASSDACVREKIASLPTEVSDPSLLKKLRDKDAAERLTRQVDEACSILSEYNNRLAQELEERRRVSSVLANFVKNQKDIMAKSEARLVEFKEKLRKVSQVRDELRSHLQNLPDLSLLPSVSGGLAPLPSAGDLFSIAAAKSLSKSSVGSTASSASPNTPSPDLRTPTTPTSTGTPNSGISECYRDEFYSRS